MLTTERPLSYDATLVIWITQHLYFILNFFLKSGFCMLTNATWSYRIHDQSNNNIIWPVPNFQLAQLYHKIMSHVILS